MVYHTIHVHGASPPERHIVTTLLPASVRPQSTSSTLTLPLTDRLQLLGIGEIFTACVCSQRLPLIGIYNPRHQGGRCSFVVHPFVRTVETSTAGYRLRGDLRSIRRNARWESKEACVFCENTCARPTIWCGFDPLHAFESVSAMGNYRRVHAVCPILLDKDGVWTRENCDV